MASSYAVEQWRRLREGRHGPGDGSGGWVRVTRPAALGADGEAPRRSAALGLLLGLRRRAVLLAVLLHHIGAHRGDLLSCNPALCQLRPIRAARV